MSGFGGGGGGGGGKSAKKRDVAESADDYSERRNDMLSGNELEFEDPFGDDFEEEELVGTMDSDDEDDEGGAASAGGGGGGGGGGGDDDDDGAKPERQYWRPGIDQLPEGEELEYDPSAYEMYHSMKTSWPCLSFDLLRDPLGDGRIRFPLTMFMVCGSQADRQTNNQLTLLKLSDLHKTQQFDSDDDDNSEEDDDNLDDDPLMENIDTPHMGGVNRVRSMPQQPGIIATFADTGNCNVYDLSAQLQALIDSSADRPSVRPSGTPRHISYAGHRGVEGYGLDWNPIVPGKIATGDIAGQVHVWDIDNSGAGNLIQLSGVTAPGVFLGHTNSLEDIQWSPTEATVFSTCSSDKTVRIWDTRSKGPMITVDNAHSADVNVISWNKNRDFLLASGSDDGSFKVWDLRKIQDSSTVAHFNYHQGPITSIQWAPHDESVISMSSSDDQLTVWDLSVEDDSTSLAAASPYPAQLLFIHQGQSNVKEIHYHPNIPDVIVSTAESGFNIFKPAISVSSST